MLVEKALNSTLGTPSLEDLLEPDDVTTPVQPSEPNDPRAGAPAARAPRATDNPRPLLVAPEVPGSSRARSQTAQAARPVPTSLTPHQVLAAHPAVRARVSARLDAIDPVASRLLREGKFNEALDRVDQLRETTAREVRSDDTAGAVLRTQLRVIAAELRYPDRQRADVATRYAQFIREYGAMNGVSAAEDSDNTLWGRVQNTGMDFLFNTYPAASGNRTLMQDLDTRNPLPPGMHDEFAAVRRRVSDPDALIREAAAMVHRYSRGAEARARGVVCRDAAEVFRKLIAIAGMNASIETITTPIGHAYNTLQVSGRELLVDAYFHPGGPIIMPRADVELRGFGSPNVAEPPRF